MSSIWGEDQIDRRQSALNVQKNTAQSSASSSQDESTSAASGVPLDVPERLPEVEVVEPDTVSSSSSVVADHHSVESMRSPSSQTIMGVLGQSIQAVSRLSTGAVLVGVDIAAPLVIRSLRGSAEAVVAHYPQEVQELTALAKQGQQRLQLLAEYVGGAGERYHSTSEQMGQHWGAVNHSAQVLQQHVQQAKSHVFGIQKEAYRSALHTGLC